MAKLDMFKGDGGSGSGGGRGGGEGGQGEAVASLMKKYQDLKEEYRLYRKKAMHAIQVHANILFFYFFGRRCVLLYINGPGVLAER